jgi:hypothetical protein
MKVWIFSAIMLLTLISVTWGQTKRPKTLDELATYTGADRQQILLEGAKAEGKVVWYTSLSGVYREIVDAFKRISSHIAAAALSWGHGYSTNRRRVASWRMHSKPLPDF